MVTIPFDISCNLFIKRTGADLTVGQSVMLQSDDVLVSATISRIELQWHPDGSAMNACAASSIHGFHAVVEVPYLKATMH